MTLSEGYVKVHVDDLTSLTCQSGDSAIKLCQIVLAQYLNA